MQPQQQPQPYWQQQPPRLPRDRPSYGPALAFILVLLIANLLVTGYIAVVVYNLTHPFG